MKVRTVLVAGGALFFDPPCVTGREPLLRSCGFCDVSPQAPMRETSRRQKSPARSSKAASGKARDPAPTAAQLSTKPRGRGFERRAASKARARSRSPNHNAPMHPAHPAPKRTQPFTHSRGRGFERGEASKARARSRSLNHNAPNDSDPSRVWGRHMISQSSPQPLEPPGGTEGGPIGAW